jgi:hypothetical protein
MVATTCDILQLKDHVSLSQGPYAKAHPSDVGKKMESFMILIINVCSFVNITFNFLMFHVGFDISTLVVNFIYDYWV